MCRRTTCSKCKKPTWAGCGAHVESVLGDVPRSERCSCRTDTPKPTKKTSPTTTRAAVGANDTTSAGTPKRSLLAKLGLR